MLLESLGKGLLDSGCSKTVAGEVWIKELLNTLPEYERSKVSEQESSSTFRFGDGFEVKAIKQLKVPLEIAGGRIVMTIDMVKNEIPLLISKGAMKQMEMQIDFRNDTVTAMGQTIKLESTSSGHYVIPVTTIGNESSKVVLHLQDIQKLSKHQKTTKALKLHKQFSHAPANRLLKLVDNSSINDKEFRDCVKEVCDTCSFCRTYKPAPLKPAVGLPLASNFNDVVCMDLVEFEHNKKWILHLIDASSRYSAATLIHTKHKDEIVKQIFRVWIAYFGCPRKFMSDNGGEFSNDVFREMNEKLNVETITTAAESPFSNGTVERHNGILKQTMFKTIDDVKCAPNMALAWAISAKNALHNHFGFSPNQIVFGFNVNIPTVLTDEPPALESRTSSDIVRMNLNAIHQARVNFMRAEASEKIRRALKHKTRTYSDEQFTNGDKVYYRRNNFKGWKGPATVLGNDGKVVLVRHGGAFYRCHRCHLMKVQKSAMRSENVVDNTEHQQKKNVNFPETPVEEFHEMSVDENQALDSDEESCIAEETEDELEEGDAEETDEGEIEENNGEGNADALQENADDDEGNSEGEEEIEFRDSNEKPKKRSWMMFENEKGEWKKAAVLSLQPKRTGTNKNWVNVDIDGEEEARSVDWDKIRRWKVIPSPENAVMMSAHDQLSQEVIDAKEKELNNLKQNNVFECVPFTNQVTISSKWIFTEKLVEGEKVIKARLVARGFEEDSSSFGTDSPTCSRTALRLVFAIAATNEWQINSLDISSAFLQGNEIEREVYLRPPADVCTKDQIWRLKRCIYRLNDAPRAWYDHVKRELIHLGAQVSKYDSAMFVWKKEKGLDGILVIHVDDFAYAGNTQWIEQVIDTFKQKFKISAQAHGCFKYIGLNVHQDDTGITVDQKKYVSSLKTARLSNERLRDKDAPLTE